MKSKKDFSNCQKIKFSHVRISPYKVQRVLKLVVGKSYSEILLLFEYLPYKFSHLLWYYFKKSPINSRQNTFIQEAFVTKGPSLKRFRPRAKGQGSPIKKRTSHITLLVTKF
jgi:large subunit ribosomal protein L22